MFISQTASKTCNDKEMNNGLMAGKLKANARHAGHLQQAK